MSDFIAIIGATGSLGRHAVEAFKASGWRVRAIARPSPRLETLRSVADEVVAADALDPGTLNEVFKNVRVALSTVGASVLPSLRYGRKSFSQVDQPANENLIAAAAAAGVQHFGYVSLLVGSGMAKLDYVRSHESAVSSLENSGMLPTIIRPTGFFSTFGEFVTMARRGIVPMFGDGRALTNPIHEADLAQACVTAMISQKRECVVGGPSVFTRRQIIEMAFASIHRKARIVRVPVVMGQLGAAAMQPLNPRVAAMIRFIIAISHVDLVAPTTGKRTLDAYFHELAQAKR